MGGLNNSRLASPSRCRPDGTNHSRWPTAAAWWSGPGPIQNAKRGVAVAVADETVASRRGEDSASIASCEMRFIGWKLHVGPSPWRSPQRFAPPSRAQTSGVGQGLGSRSRCSSSRTVPGWSYDFLNTRHQLGDIHPESVYKLDITWLKDESLEDSDELPEPQDLASAAITELEAVVDALREIVALVEKEEGVEV